MRILFVAAEASPLAKVGGLADVVGSLPKALSDLGHEVRIIIPKYGCIDLSRYPTRLVGSWQVPIMSREEPATLKTTTLKETIPAYLIENHHYFGGNEIYGDNDLERFLFFSRAVFEILPRLDWQPEIVHCHDWHTALLPLWLKRAGYPHISLFTIHNLAYQGAFNEAFLDASGLKDDWQDYPPEIPQPSLNFMSQGILWADRVTTVSETYAKEIVTPEYGEGLDPLLRHRQQDLWGIVNGIDYVEYNPSTDPYIAANFDALTLDKRGINKLALQEKANLTRSATSPLIGMVQRLDEQKGMDILEKAIGPILKGTEAQIVIQGKGREYYETGLREVASRYSQRVAALITFDEPLAHLIYAACDMFLMPSRFEPCGLGQLIAMRYGALPVVRHTGGLVDTVSDLTPDLDKENGFVFHDYSSEALVAAVKRATVAFRSKAWQKAVVRVMGLDFSWQASARKYEAAYQSASRRKNQPK